MYPCRQNRKPPAVSHRRRYGKLWAAPRNSRRWDQHRPPDRRLSDRAHRPLSSSEPRDRPSAEFGSHEAYGFPQKHEFPNILMQDGKFRHFIIITIMMPFEHDSVIRRENALGDPLAR